MAAVWAAPATGEQFALRAYRMNPKKRVAWRLEGYNTTIYPCTLAGDWYLCNFTLSPNFNFTNTSTAFRVIFTPLSDRLGLINTTHAVFGAHLLVAVGF